jgi:hypothetical protein
MNNTPHSIACLQSEFNITMKPLKVVVNLVKMEELLRASALIREVNK